jgi:hypothetical protein
MRNFSLLVTLGLASMVCMVAACGGSSGESSSGSLPDGGTTLPDGAVNPDAGGDAGACPPAPTKVLEANAGSLDVSGDEVVFMDNTGGVDFLSTTDKTKAVRKVKLDGTGDTVLHAAAAMHQINDVKTVGTTVYFLESERDEFGNEATSLFSMPISGGTPTLIGKHVDPTVGLDFDRLDAIIAADAGSVYVGRGAATGEGSLWRFAVAGGAETLVYRGSIKTKPQMVASDFYFLSGSVPSGQVNFDSVVKVAAAGGTPVAVGTSICRGDLTAAASGLLCAGAGETMTSSKLSHWDLAGAGHAVLFELPTSGQVVNIGPSDGTSVYVESAVREGTKTSLFKVPLAGGPATVVACDREEITRRKTTAGSGSNGAYVSELDMVTTPTEIVWTETRKESGQPHTIAIWRTAR